MMNELLRLLLMTVDAADSRFDAATVATWPAEAVPTFTQLGILRQAAGQLYAPCPDCDGGHTEPVTIRAGPDGARRFYIHCPESLRVEVTPERCLAWQIDYDGLAQAVATLVGLAGTPQMVVPNRFWRLGRVSWPPGAQRTRPVVLARCLRDDDASTLAAHVGPAGRALVLVPHLRPDERIWQGRVPAVVALTEVMTWENDRAAFDVMALIDAVATADERAEAAEAVALGSAGKNMVRRQVKAEIKTLLTDDAYVAAYLEHGSLRKAAEALTAQTGQRISKDKVRRAVERRGGRAQIIPVEDSVSVARTVASQPRDRARKILERR